MRKLLLALALLLAALCPRVAAAGDETVHVTLVHDTHFHGEFANQDGVTLAQLVGMVQRLRAEHRHTLFVGAGDDVAPSLYSGAFRGAHMIEALNAAGLDVDTFGNHEFDYGPDTLRARIAESAFPWVTANVRDAHTDEVFGADLGVRSFLLRDVGGVTFGFTGFAPPETPRVSSPGPDVRVLDPVQAAREVVPRMRAAGAQIVVALCHLAWPQTEALVAAVEGIDVAVGDHAATALAQPRVVNGTIVSRRGDGLALLGQLDLAIRHGRIIDWRYTEHRVSPFGPTDAAVAQVIGRYEEALNLALGEAIGASAVPLDAGTEASRTRETNLGNLVADALRDWGRTDVGLQNGGGIRGDRVYPPGPITQRDLTTILPFANYGAAVRLSGAELWAVLEHSVGRIDERAGRFLQVSGLAFSYDPAAPVGSRVSAVRVGGAPLDPAAEYTVALSDFLAAGGDDYGVLEGAEVLIPGASGPLLTNLVADYIAARGSVAPVEEGRIRTVGDGD